MWLGYWSPCNKDVHTLLYIASAPVPVYSGRTVQGCGNYFEQGGGGGTSPRVQGNPYPNKKLLGFGPLGIFWEGLKFTRKNKMKDLISLKTNFFFTKNLFTIQVPNEDTNSE